MALLTDIAALIPTLCGRNACDLVPENSGEPGGDFSAATGDASRSATATATNPAPVQEQVSASSEMQARMLAMSDGEIHAVMQEASAVERQAALLRQIATGIA